jgi:hypothetical protein
LAQIKIAEATKLIWKAYTAKLEKVVNEPKKPIPANRRVRVGI